MDYKLCLPLRIHPALVWEIEFNDGRKKLLITATEFLAPRIVELIKLQHPGKKFVVSNVNVGTFNLDKNCPVDHSYKSDARQLDQDMQVSI